ncbi:MAG: hypothetical protein L3K09_04255, partial [Thermoplasmata archaeon]|nr:hypothetical protein [Thermoplasmata archaeon]
MRHLAVVVPRALGEATRSALREAGVLLPGFKVARSGEELAFAVREAPTPLPEGSRTEERDFDE